MTTVPKFQLPNLTVSKVVATVETQRLVLINRNPEPNESNVPINGTIELQIANTGPGGIDTNATMIWVDEVLAFNGTILPGFNGFRQYISQSLDSITIVLDPVIPFVSMAQMDVRVVSSTAGAQYSIDESYSFIVEDKTAPRVLAAQAINAKQIEIAFDEDVKVVDVSAFTCEAMGAPAVPVNAVATETNGSVVLVTVNTEMTPDVRYRFFADGIVDLNGNSVLPPFDNAVFQGFAPYKPSNRRFDLWSMLPRYNRRADETGDLRNFIDCLQEVTDLLLAEIDRFPDIFDIERAPESFLDLILKDLGNPFYFDLSIVEKRRLASILIELYRQSGTGIGIKNAIRFFLGIEIEILPFAADTMILGESELGVDWILGPSSRFALYAFDIRVKQMLTETQQKQIRSIVSASKPAHTHFVSLKMPEIIIEPNHWELGISTIGSETVLH